MAQTYASSSTEKKQDPKSSGPNKPSIAFAEMAERWPRIQALSLGTQGMRDYGKDGLPQWEKESEPAYKRRLARSYLVDFFGDTVEKLTARPFSKPLSILGSVPPEIERMLDDCDGQGTTMHEFAAEMLRDALRFGPSYLFVDWTGDEPAATLAEQREMALRPVFRHIRHDGLLAVESSTTQAGRVLDGFRVREWRTERVPGTFDEARVLVIVQVRRTDSDGFERVEWTWDKERGEWVEGEARPFGAEGLNGIPLTCLLTSQSGYFTSDPPLERLAELNELHWQTYSDHSNNMAFAGVLMLFAAGWSSEELEKGVVVSPYNLVGTTKSDGKLSFLEPSASGLEARRVYLQDIEARMTVLGAQPLLEQAANRTATEVRAGESRSESILNSWVRQLENVLTEGLRYAAQWLGIELDEDVRVEIFSDWAVSGSSSEEVAVIDRIRARGDLSHVTFLKELLRRGVLSESVDAEQEAQDAQDEAPSLTGAQPGNPFGAPPPADPEDPDAEEAP